MQMNCTQGKTEILWHSVWTMLFLRAKPPVANRRTLQTRPLIIKHKMHAQRISFLRPAPPWTLFLISTENKATAGVLSTNIKAAWSNKFCPHRYPANTRRDKTEHICFREIFTLVFRQTWHCSITSGWGWGGDRTGGLGEVRGNQCRARKNDFNITRC